MLHLTVINGIQKQFISSWCNNERCSRSITYHYLLVGAVQICLRGCKISLGFKETGFVDIFGYNYLAKILNGANIGLLADKSLSLSNGFITFPGKLG